MKTNTSYHLDYYPFGMVMPGRSYTSSDGDYRFGFNGKEKDDEGMGGGGSTYDYGFRIYNPQLGKFLSVDPLMGSYPMLTPYQFASNTPIVAIDLDGLEAEIKNMAVTCTSDESVLKVSADVEIKIKVLDLSNLPNKNIQTVYSNAQTKFDKILNSKSGKTNVSNAVIDYEGNSLTGVDFSITTDVNFSLSFTTIESVSEIQDEDFILILVDSRLTPESSNGRIPPAYVIGKGENVGIIDIGSSRFKPYQGDFLISSAIAKDLYSTMVHEILHMLGLGDEYTENENKTTTPKEGYEYNVMGNSSTNGITEKQIGMIVNHILNDNSWLTRWQRQSPGTQATVGNAKDNTISLLEKEGLKYE